MLAPARESDARRLPGEWGGKTPPLAIFQRLVEGRLPGRGEPPTVVDSGCASLRTCGSERALTMPDRSSAGKNTELPLDHLARQSVLQPIAEYVEFLSHYPTFRLIAPARSGSAGSIGLRGATTK
jgi:hypothetical protein